METAESPLLALKPLYRLYRVVGAFPASFDDHCRVFEVKWKYYLPHVILLGTMLIVSIWDSNPWDDQVGLPEAMKMQQDLERPENVNATYTQLDKTFGHMHFTLIYLCFVTVLILNHRTFKRYSDTISMINTQVHCPIKPILIHHAIITVCNIIASGVTGIALAIQMDGWSLFTFRMIPWQVTLVIIMIWINIVVSLPEVTTIRLLQAISLELSNINQGLRNVQKDTDTLLERCIKVEQAFESLNEGFGGYCVLIIGMATGQVILGSFFTIGLMGIASFGLYNASKYFMLICYVMEIVVGLKRLFIFTKFTQHFLDEKDSMIKLILLNKELRQREDAKAIIALFSRINGFSAKGFFNVDRSILTSIFGHLLTYLIILIEFKLDDLE